MYGIESLKLWIFLFLFCQLQELRRYFAFSCQFHLNVTSTPLSNPCMESKAWSYGSFFFVFCQIARTSQLLRLLNFNFHGHLRRSPHYILHYALQLHVGVNLMKANDLPISSDWKNFAASFRFKISNSSCPYIVFFFIMDTW